jgi:hypothetical protein
MRKCDLAVLSCLVSLALAADARAVVVAPPPPLIERVRQADLIVVGRIVELEPADALAFPMRKASKKVSYKIAVLKVSEVIKGSKEHKTVRLAFFSPVGPGGVTRPGGPGIGPRFKVGQEGLFYLSKHFQEDFFIAGRFFDFVSSEILAFEQEAALCRYAMKVGGDPAKGLQAKDAQDRLLAAALLLQQYRIFRGGLAKTEPIDARESKLILTALADADWNQDGPIHPWGLFKQLGLTAKDGWTLPRNAKRAADFYQAAQAWLREHAATYRIQRVVVTKAAKTP